MRKLALRILAFLLVLLLLAGCFVFWFLKFGGGDDPTAGDEDLIPPASEPVPVSENGFVPLEAAAGLIHLPDEEGRADWPIPAAQEEAGKEANVVNLDDFFSRMMVGKAWDNALAAAVLERNQRVFELVTEVLARPRFQTPPPQELGGQETYLITARDAAYLLEFRSRALAKEGHTREAIDAALQVVRLGRRLEQGGGGLMDYLVGSSMQEIGLRPLRSLVPRMAPDEIRRVLEEVGELRPDAGSLRMALRREYAFFAARIDAVAAGKLQVLQTMSIDGFHGPPAGPGPEGFYETLNETFITSRYYFKPLRTRRLVAEAVRILLEEIEKTRTQRTRSLSSRCGVTFALDHTVSNGVGAFIAEQNIGTLESSVDSGDDLEVAFSATSVLLALQAYKLESGALPATLSELVPRFLDAVPRDPFDGVPLRYSREKLRIWAVGRDLVDSGGGELGPDGEWSPSEEDEPTFRIE